MSHPLATAGNRARSHPGRTPERLEPRVFVSTNDSNAPMRKLLRSEGWNPSGILTGLDEDGPEHVFFHDARPGPEYYKCRWVPVWSNMTSKVVFGQSLEGGGPGCAPPGSSHRA